MPTASNGAVSATVPSPWSHGRSPAPAGRARGSSASGGGSWTLPQARERAMARADHVRAGLTIRCAVYTRGHGDLAVASRHAGLMPPGCIGHDRSCDGRQSNGAPLGYTEAAEIDAP